MDYLQREYSKLQGLKSAFEDLESGEITAREYENIVARIEEEHEDD